MTLNFSVSHSVCLSASSLIHSIATRVIKLAQAKSSIALAPALVETYSRLLVYMEIESLGIKGFISESLKHVHLLRMQRKKGLINHFVLIVQLTGHSLNQCKTG